MATTGFKYTWIIALAAGCGSTEDLGSGVEDLAEGRTVEVRVGVFIPCEALASPEPRFSRFYKGDGRTFDYERSLTDSRVAVRALVEPDASSDVERFVGESHAYTGDKIDGYADEQGCYKLKRDEEGNFPEPDRTDRADDSDITSAVSVLSETEVMLEVQLHATNPLALAAPAVDGALFVTVAYDGADDTRRPVSYHIEGKHDPYPAFEIYLNGQAAYTYDGLEAGYGPVSLAPGWGYRATVDVDGEF